MKKIIKSILGFAASELTFIRIAFYLSLAKNTEHISEEIANYFSDIPIS